jgi:hypothetical protein
LLQQDSISVIKFYELHSSLDVKHLQSIQAACQGQAPFAINTECLTVQSEMR